MNFPLFIARRLWSGKHHSFSRPILKVAIAGIALSLVVMILSVAVLIGFKNKISEKVLGFSPHIQVGTFDLNHSMESEPFTIDHEVVRKIQQIQGIRLVQAVAYKAGIVKAEDQIQGFVFKGVDKNFDWSFFKNSLITGRLPQFTDTVSNRGILISKTLASKMKLKTGDKFKAYFVSNGELRTRAFDITGIYNTGFAEFDEKMVLGDINQVRKLNNWNENQADGLEVYIHNFDEQTPISDQIYSLVHYDQNVITIKEQYIDIFSWLNLINSNVILILVIMSVLVLITMISALLILILESVNMIGILKALGTSSNRIRKIFLWQSLFVLVRGLLWGNVLALLICFLQIKFSIFKLNPESYHVSEVPVELSFYWILIVNAAIIAVSILCLILPSSLISKISPDKAIRFD